MPISTCQGFTGWEREKRHDLRKLTDQSENFFVQTAGAGQPKPVILKTLHQLHPCLLLQFSEEETGFEGEHSLGVTVTLLGAISVKRG